MWILCDFGVGERKVCLKIPRKRKMREKLLAKKDFLFLCVCREEDYLD